MKKNILGHSKINIYYIKVNNICIKILLQRVSKVSCVLFCINYIIQRDKIFHDMLNGMWNNVSSRDLWLYF